MCLSPLFIGYFPPVYLEDHGQITCVREKWGAKEYAQKSATDFLQICGCCCERSEQQQTGKVRAYEYSDTQLRNEE